MQLSEYVASLQEFLEEHGDMLAVYARDDEGNEYHHIPYAGSKYFAMKQDVGNYTVEVYSEKEIEEYPDDEFVPVCIVN